MGGSDAGRVDDDPGRADAVDENDADAGDDESTAGEYDERVRTLAARAARDRAAFEPPAAPPDEERAMEYLRDGAGQAIALYVHARTGGRTVPFTGEQLSALREAMNTWFSLYARCYGVSLDAEFTVHQAAEALLDTRNVADAARILTGVPPRRDADD